MPSSGASRTPRAPRRRADAERSRTAILEAALRLLNDQPGSSMETIAAAAGVSRQTVYAHFPAREELLTAVIERITHESVTAMDTAGEGGGPAAEVLIRQLKASWELAGRYPGLLQQIPAAAPAPPQTEQERHQPISERLLRVIEKGRRSGEFDAGLSAGWLVAAVIGLAHAAGEEVAAGRLSHAAAWTALRISVLRLTGAAGPGPDPGSGHDSKHDRDREHDREPGETSAGAAAAQAEAGIGGMGHYS